MTTEDFEKIKVEARKNANENIRFGFILGFVIGAFFSIVICYLIL